MNLQLSDDNIRSTCRDLMEQGVRVSGRRLCDELRMRYGAVGKTQRVFRIWRQECPATTASSPSLPSDIVTLQRRLEAAESEAAEHLARAERAEYREQAHQDHWAGEIDRLRQAARNQADYAATILALQRQVLALSKELKALRAQMADPKF